jgi:hypothetical protein
VGGRHSGEEELERLARQDQQRQAASREPQDARRKTHTTSTPPNAGWDKGTLRCFVSLPTDKQATNCKLQTTSWKP